MDNFQENVNEILEILKPEEINDLCEYDLYNGWVQKEQIYMVSRYKEYLKDKKRLQEEFSNPLIVEFNKSLEELDSFLLKYFFTDGGNINTLVKFEGERKNEGEHLKRYEELQALNNDFHEKYTKLRIELAKRNKDSKQVETIFKIEHFEDDGKYYFNINNLKPISVTRVDFKFISHFKNSSSELTRKDLELEGVKNQNSFTSSMNRLNKELKKINYLIKNIGLRGSPIYKIIKL